MKTAKIDLTVNDKRNTWYIPGYGDAATEDEVRCQVNRNAPLGFTVVVHEVTFEQNMKSAIEELLTDTKKPKI